VLGEISMLAILCGVLLLAIAVPCRLFGNFGVLRGLCHGLFCVAVPLLAWRAFCARRHYRWLAAVVLVGCAVAEAAYVFARHVEPYRLEVTTAHLTSPRLDALPRHLRVAVVADLQTDAITDYEIGVFDRLVASEPDLVLFLGDYLQLPPAELHAELPALQAQVRRLTPPFGMFAVDGDIDIGGAKAVFEGTGVRVISNQHAALPGLPIDVVGLSRMRSRAPFLDAQLVQQLRGERYCIVIGHAPDFMQSVVRDGLQADALFVAGHTHGGQVQIPGFGPPLTLSSVPRWLGGGGVFRRGDTWLCCSRGIGMERSVAPRIRFWCRPQLILLELGTPSR
jgi:predicted MPP superfamily phosphohydrolase